MRKVIFFTFLVLLVIGSIFYLTLNETTAPTESNNPEEVDSLKFSNTMSWDPQFQNKAYQETHLIKDWQEKIILLPPPTNSSAETQQEINLLLSYKSFRTEEALIQIKKEVNPDTTFIGGYSLKDYFDTEKLPLTAMLMRKAYPDLETILFYYKKYFDRVRPSALEPKLEPVIEIPGHAAYPSGHSTQAHFIAYILSELRPAEKSSLLAEADAIAKNRELAGLHYPSDSAAGDMLARQYLDLILTLPDVQMLINQAKKEW